MRWEFMFSAALACLTWTEPAAAEDSRTLSYMRADPNAPELVSTIAFDACMQAAGATSPDHVLTGSLGAYIGASGQVLDIAILNSFGNRELDEAVLACVRQARFALQAPKRKTVYGVFTINWKPAPPPKMCSPTVPTATVELAPVSSTPPQEERHAIGETVVCGCLNEGDKEPSEPVVLSPSGNADLDDAAVRLMTATAAKQWTQPFGCTAWKVVFKR